MHNQRKISFIMSFNYCKFLFNGFYSIFVTIYGITSSEIYMIKLPFSQETTESIKLFLNFFLRNFCDVNISLKFSFLLLDYLFLCAKIYLSFPPSAWVWTNLATTLRQELHVRHPVKSWLTSINNGWRQQWATGYWMGSTCYDQYLKRIFELLLFLAPYKSKASTQ